MGVLITVIWTLLSLAEQPSGNFVRPAVAIINSYDRIWFFVPD